MTENCDNPNGQGLEAQLLSTFLVGADTNFAAPELWTRIFADPGAAEWDGEAAGMLEVRLEDGTSFQLSCETMDGGYSLHYATRSPTHPETNCAYWSVGTPDTMDERVETLTLAEVPRGSFIDAKAAADAFHQFVLHPAKAPTRITWQAVVP